MRSLKKQSDPVPMNRRQALAVFGGAAFGAAFAKPAFAEEILDNEIYVASVRLTDGRDAIATVNGSGTLLNITPIPARGHDFAVRGDGLVVAFARRPGTFAVAGKPGRETALPQKVFFAPADRHFNGHGAFSSDGRLLYASENDFAGGRGCVGVYETSNFSRVGEFSSGGVGPHEILLLPNGVLAVANGGIETHPDFPRAKLNMDSMQPNLAYIEPKRGDLTELQSLPPHLHHLSIRHLTWSSVSNQVWFGCQWEGDTDAGVALVGRHSRGKAIDWLEMPQGGWGSMRGYIGSVATNADGTLIAVSSPRGGKVCIWRANGTFQRMVNRADVSGLSPSASAILATDGQGTIGSLFKTSAAPVLGISAFDNHLRRVATS
jgi:hypothetical protein